MSDDDYSNSIDGLDVSLSVALVAVVISFAIGLVAGLAFLP